MDELAQVWDGNGDLVPAHEAATGHMLLDGLGGGGQRVLQCSPLHSIISHVHELAVVLAARRELCLFPTAAGLARLLRGRRPLVA